MNILGISCYYHDSAACLISDGKVISAAQEERFNRLKNSSVFPIRAINYCLQVAGISVYDIDYVAFYEKPFLKFQRVILNHLKSYPFSIKNFLNVMPYWLDERLIVPLLLKKEAGYEGKVLFVKHHLAHAASTFLVSPFKKAAIMTSDGIGEWTTMTIGKGDESNIEICHELHYPNSLGLLYSAITAYLGFEANRGEGKVMALADYGKPVYVDKFKEIIKVKEDGSFKIDSRYFGFNTGSKMYNDKFVKLFGKARIPETNFEQRHYDIAASLQKIVEEILIKIAKDIYKRTNLDNLCLAGGTFLNCVVNRKILEETNFKEIFIQPAAGDAGGALGAALYVYNSLLKNQRRYVMDNAYLGPEFSESKIKKFLLSKDVKFKKFNDSKLVKYIANKIAHGKIIGWFQDRMEWGPRALGNRSILADPRNPKMKDILNKKVKHREWFRPYGISILLEELNGYFDLGKPSPFMLLVGNVKEPKKKLIPSAIHTNGTSRIQTITKEENGIFYDLVKEFQNITGIPMIINTSFNDKNEPIVCTPEDAYNCFLNTQIDYLVLKNFVIDEKRVKNDPRRN